MFGMFTEAGNNAVAKIVNNGRGLVELGYSVESAWDWAQNELHILAETYDFEEAEDTAVREAVYEAVVLG